MKKRGRKKYKRNKVQRRLLAILAVSLLFFGCLLADCYKKGLLFHGQDRQESFGQKESKKEGTGKNRDRKQIRVLLTNTDQSAVFHQEVSISSNQEFTVEKNGKKESYEAGETVTFGTKGWKKSWGDVVVSCPRGRLKVTSLRRRQQIPAYRGKLILNKTSRGILLVNRLPLGEYLYGVLPSEMSAEYPLEALKAQAVCARSFAWRQMQSDAYKKYGADVDDTTACQVYGMAQESARCVKAVKATAGKMLFHGKEVITTYYYATSWGCSATVKEVWGGEKNASCYPRKLQITLDSQKETGLTSLDLSDEKIFQSFLSDTLCDTYDGESDWYRWKITIPAKELGARLGLGKVEQIQVVKREQSGLLSRLRVVGTRGRITLSGQQEIREKLMVAGRQIEKKDGTKVEFSMLPSAAFLIRQGVEGKKACFVFFGGGFGHGAGMSQTGAAGMAKSGCSYKDIVNHYFNDCELR